MEILEITLTLRQRSSMMPSTFSMFRHPMIIYCPSYVHFRGLCVAAARDSKTVLTDPAMCTDQSNAPGLRRRAERFLGVAAASGPCIRSAIKNRALPSDWQTLGVGAIDASVTASSSFAWQCH